MSFTKSVTGIRLNIQLSVLARWLLAVLTLTGGGWLIGQSLSYSLATRHALAAETHLSWGRLEAALASLQKAQSLSPLDAQRARDLGEIYLLMHRWRDAETAAEAALNAFKQAVRLNPLSGALRAALAQAYTQLGFFEKAENAFAAALARDPHNAYYLSAWGLSKEQAGEKSGAIALYQRALAVEDNEAIRARLEALRHPAGSP